MRSQPVGIFHSKFLKASLVKGFSYAFHKSVVEVEIVNDCQTSRKLFISLEQMSEICPGEIAAGGTVALGVKGQRVSFIAFV